MVNIIFHALRRKVKIKKSSNMNDLDSPYFLESLITG